MLAVVSDMLDRIRNELDGRIAALRPLADEFDRLQRAAEALGELDAPGTSARPGASARAARASRARPRPGSRAKPARRRRSSGAGATRAAPGQTQLRVIEQLRSSPGSSSTAVAQALGISANAAAATISRLVRQGRVSRLDSGGYVSAQPASDQTGTGSSAPGAPDGADS